MRTRSSYTLIVRIVGVSLKGPSTKLLYTLQNSNLHSHYPKTENLIIGSFGPLGFGPEGAVMTEPNPKVQRLDLLTIGRVQRRQNRPKGSNAQNASFFLLFGITIMIWGSIPHNST